LTVSDIDAVSLNNVVVVHSEHLPENTGKV